MKPRFFTLKVGAFIKINKKKFYVKDLNGWTLMNPEWACHMTLIEAEPTFQSKRIAKK